MKGPFCQCGRTRRTFMNAVPVSRPAMEGEKLRQD
jgi:hypothetical protein